LHDTLEPWGDTQRHSIRTTLPPSIDALLDEETRRREASASPEADGADEADTSQAQSVGDEAAREGGSPLSNGGDAPKPTPIITTGWQALKERLLAAHASLPLGGSRLAVASFVLEAFIRTRDRVSMQAVEIEFPYEFESLTIANRLVDQNILLTEAVTYVWPALELVAARPDALRDELCLLDQLIGDARAIYETPGATRRVKLSTYLARLRDEDQRLSFRLLCFSLAPFLQTVTGSVSTNEELEVRQAIRSIEGLAGCVEHRVRRHVPQTKQSTAQTQPRAKSRTRDKSANPAAIGLIVAVVLGICAALIEWWR
jgi:hypothetical protein